MLRCLLTVILGCMLQGCIATVTLWSKPARSTVREPLVLGVAWDDEKCAHNRQYLVVEYVAEWFILDGIRYIKYDYAIPIENGHAPALFENGGVQRDPSDILKNLSQDETERIGHYRMSWRSWRMARSLKRRKKIVDVNTTVNGVFCTRDAILIHLRPDEAFGGPPVRVIAWWQGSDIDPKQLQQMKMEPQWPRYGNKLTFGPSAPPHILILPSHQRRFVTERTQSIAFAILLTPATLALDIALIPLIAVTEPSFLSPLPWMKLLFLAPFQSSQTG